MKRTYSRSSKRRTVSSQTRGLRRDISRIKSSLSSSEESSVLKAIRNLTLWVQLIASVTAVAFFIIWILESSDRAEERRLRAFNTSLRKVEIIEESKYSKPLPGLNQIVIDDYKKSSKSKTFCNLDIKGQSVSLGVIDDIDCLFIVDKSIIHETILHGENLSVLPFNPLSYQRWKQGLANYDLGSKKTITISDGSVSDSSYPLAVRKSLLNVNEINGLIDIRGSVAMNINEGRVNWHAVGSVFTNINQDIESSYFEKSYLHNSNFINKDYGTLILEDVVLDNTIIEFSSESSEELLHYGETIHNYIIIKNVCVLNGGAILGIELPTCRFEQLREITKPIDSSEKATSEKEISSLKSEVNQGLKLLSKKKWRDNEWSQTGAVFGIATSQYPYFLPESDLGPFAMNIDFCDPYFLYEQTLEIKSHEDKNEELNSNVEFIRLFQDETESNRDLFIKPTCRNSDSWSDEKWDHFFDIQEHIIKTRPEALDHFSRELYEHIVFLKPSLNSEYNEDEFLSIIPEFTIPD